MCAPSCFFVKELSVAASPARAYVFVSDRCKETQALFAGVDVVVTTPFRLILHLGKADMVLNEARERKCATIKSRVAVKPDRSGMWCSMRQTRCATPSMRRK